MKKELSETITQSNLWDVIVNQDFIKHEEEHFDNPNKKGMILKEEVLSFPKVAKNVKPKIDNLKDSRNQNMQNLTWKTKADDGSEIVFGSRKYDDTHRLLTVHSRTQRGQRQVDRISSTTYFNDPNRHGSIPTDIVPKNPNEPSQSLKKTEDEKKDPKSSNKTIKRRR